MLNINQKSPDWLTNILSGVIGVLALLLSMKEEIINFATLVGFDLHVALITKIFAILTALLAIVKMFFSKLADGVVQSFTSPKINVK